MTYCVGLRLDRGLVMMSDTRTTSGVDNVSQYRKMHTFFEAGDRYITILTSGNLGTTQALVSTLEERSKLPENREPSIMSVPTMFQVASLVGSTLRSIIESTSPTGMSGSGPFSASLLVGGQIGTMEPRLYLVYPEGNFVETSNDTQFLQIGETKYGRPILVRAYEPTMSFEDAVRLLLVSFDSTIKANLTVGYPVDVQIYEADSLAAPTEFRLDLTDAYTRRLSQGWAEALRGALDNLDSFEMPASTFRAPLN